MFVDGMDAYTTVTEVNRKWHSADTTNVLFGSTAGRFGGGALTLNAHALNLLNHDFGGNADDIGLAFALKSGSTTKPTSISYSLIQIYNNSYTPNYNFPSAADALSLAVNSSGFFSITKFRSTSAVATGSINVWDTNWHWIEIRVKIADSGGIIQIYVDGVLDIDFSGDTIAATPTLGGYANKISFFRPYSNSGTPILDDVIIYSNLDTDFAPASKFPLGDKKITTVYPSGAGANTNWTPSSGANYAAVDETGGANTTDYVDATADGTRDTYAFGDLSGSPTITAVAVNVVGKNVNAGSISVEATVKSGATTTDALAGIMAADYKSRQAIFVNDPNTSAAWTATNFNAAEIGITAVV